MHRSLLLFAAVLVGTVFVPIGMPLRAEHQAVSPAGTRAGLQAGRCAEIARIVLELTRKNGGATVSLNDGNMVGKPLFAVVLDPLLGESFESTPSIDDVARFIRKHERTLLTPSKQIGAWYDEKGDRTFLDVTTTFSDFDLAMKAGLLAKQEYLYDLDEERNVDIGIR